MIFINHEVMIEQIGTDTIGRMCLENGFDSFHVRKVILLHVAVDDRIRRTIEHYLKTPGAQ